jgi:hypothetical protein
MAGLAAASPALCVAGDSASGPASSAKVPAARLTAQEFDRFLKADNGVTAALKRDRNLDMAIAASANMDAIDGMHRRIQASPAAIDAIKASGMSDQGYFQTYLALLQAAAASGIKKQGKEIPPALARAVPAENLAFIEKHPAEVGAWMHEAGIGPAHTATMNPGNAAVVKPNTIEDLYTAPAPAPKKKEEKAPPSDAPPAPVPK